MTDDVNKGRFVKGDPRCWRKGKPKEFNALRDLAQEIASEKVKSGGQPVVIDGHAVTVAEAILRQWATSKDWQRQKGFMEIAFGKVPDKVEMTGKDGRPIEYTDLTDAELDREIIAAARRIGIGSEVPLVPEGAPATDTPAG